MGVIFDVGNVSIEGGGSFRWSIPGYLHTPREPGTVLRSPDFTLGDRQPCSLEACQSGFRNDSTEGWLGIFCVIPFLPVGSSLRCSMLGRDGQEILHTIMLQDYEDRFNYYECAWIRQTELKARWQELLPRGRLRLAFRVDFPDRRGQESGVHNLLQNFKDLYLQGDDCDFTFRVRGREFRTHRLVLKVRIPAFCAMLTHDTKENKEGVVDIQDCDPDAFNQFLLFVYSGRVENLTTNNMCGLYILGDKYGLPDLKNACLHFMKTSLTVETICDVISLASMHDEAGLLELATDFFVRNSGKILVMARWREFMEENPTQGHELFLKTVNKIKSENN